MRGKRYSQNERRLWAWHPVLALRRSDVVALADLREPARSAVPHRAILTNRVFRQVGEIVLNTGRSTSFLTTFT